MTAPPVTIWLIEDHAAYRRTVARWLTQAGEFHCAQTFARAEAALAALREGVPPPRVILLDVGLPGMDGVGALPRLRELAPQALVIILTAFEDEGKIVRAICAGASGYLLKTAAPEEITRAIREALNGGAPMNGRIARRVLEMFSQLVPKQTDYGLTPREREILQLMAEGFLKKEIANRLRLSFHTVDTHLRNIYSKLEVNSRTSAVAKALKEKLI